MLTFSFFNIFILLADRISTSCGEGWRKRLALVFTARLSGTKVELEPLRRRIPLNVARV